jgi:hypothetical protein
MYQPRTILSDPAWLDPDGIKIYTVSARHQPVDQFLFRTRLVEVKAQKSIAWSDTPAFVIFHDGSSALYLVLAWWGNDNELFTSVSVRTDAGWIEDPSRFSFCLWDMEVMWFERNAFIDCVYSVTPDLNAYRATRKFVIEERA